MRSKWLVSFFFLFTSFSVMAATSSSAELNDLLTNFHSMSATFAQKTIVKNGVTKSSSGTMALKRPGKFRWEITQPNHQIIVADGQYLWIYDVDLEQATRRNLNDANSPAILLSGSTAALEERFSVENLETKGAKKIFHLKPKTEQDMFQNVDIEFNNGKLAQMSVFDNLGQKNIFYFNNVKINPSLSSSLFQFKAPTGVDIIKE